MLNGAPAQAGPDYINVDNVCAHSTNLLLTGIETSEDSKSSVKVNTDTVQGDPIQLVQPSTELVFINHTHLDDIKNTERKRKRPASPARVDFRTIMDPSQPEQYIFEVEIPNKVPHMRKRTKKEIADRKAIARFSPCIRCRRYKLKCSQGVPCHECQRTSRSGPLWNRVCCRINILADGDALKKKPV